ncbi:hypothetical protein AP058_01891 [Flavobacterium sp. TAB 87]|nr:hypothetical protein AP058_01891 [Flavobacterium sp. TAB 87]
MNNKVFHVRVKIISNRTFYLKGICIAKTSKIARDYAKAQTDNYLSLSTKGNDAVIKVVECKELRSDFIIHHQNESN